VGCVSESEPVILFCVDASYNGISVAPEPCRMGLEMVKTATVHLNRVMVPDDACLGDDATLKCLWSGHWIDVAALALGVGRGAMDRALAYVRKRSQFGKPIGAFRITRQKVARLSGKLELARLATRRAAELFDLGKADEAASALARISATKAAVAVSDEAIQLLGGYGYMTEYDVERSLRDAKTLELLGGERSLLEEILADRELGKRRR